MIDRARQNAETLNANPYPGRGLVIGMNEDGSKILQAYWLMGRSPGSRNRIFVDDGGGILRTDLADASQKPADTSLIIYRAMDESRGYFVVSNGHQTSSILNCGSLGSPNYYEAVRKWKYEPDAPNYTPRITCALFVAAQDDVFLKTRADILIHKESALGVGCERHIFQLEKFRRGFGHCITTYSGDGNPLPSFQGEPYILPLTGSPEAVANDLWNLLNPENRVALAVKAISVKTRESSIHIINKF